MKGISYWLRIAWNVEGVLETLIDLDPKKFEFSALKVVSIELSL